jgi:hypothetical protein
MLLAGVVAGAKILVELKGESGVAAAAVATKQNHDSKILITLRLAMLHTKRAASAAVLFGGVAQIARFVVCAFISARYSPGVAPALTPLGYRTIPLIGLSRRGGRASQSDYRLTSVESHKGETMILAVFTLFHVVLSVIGIAAGVVVLIEMIRARRLGAWNSTFLITTAATSLTGFFFPIHGITPGLVIGTISIVVLAVAMAGLYRYHLAGGWRRTYVIAAAFALYLNMFVLVVQLFMKVPALRAIAPTQSEPPFAAVQLVVLTLMLVLGSLAAIRFREQPLPLISRRAA